MCPRTMALQINILICDNEMVPLRAIGEQTPMLTFERIGWKDIEDILPRQSDANATNHVRLYRFYDGRVHGPCSKERSYALIEPIWLFLPTEILVVLVRIVPCCQIAIVRSDDNRCCLDDSPGALRMEGILANHYCSAIAHHVINLSSELEHLHVYGTMTTPQWHTNKDFQRLFDLFLRGDHFIPSRTKAQSQVTRASMSPRWPVSKGLWV